MRGSETERDGVRRSKTGGDGVIIVYLKQEFRLSYLLSRR